MMINTSGTCATTRLVQCRDFGVMMNDVSRKFDKDPEDVPDLSRDDFVSRQIVLKQTEGIRQMWTPILYMYEVCIPRFTVIPLFRRFCFDDGPLVACK